MNYYIIVNHINKTYNAFDEDNLKFMSFGDEIIATITGEDNVDEVMKILFIILPRDYKQFPWSPDSPEDYI